MDPHSLIWIAKLSDVQKTLACLNKTKKNLKYSIKMESRSRVSKEGSYRFTVRENLSSFSIRIRSRVRKIGENKSKRHQFSVWKGKHWVGGKSEKRRRRNSKSYLKLTQRAWSEASSRAEQREAMAANKVENIIKIIIITIRLN